MPERVWSHLCENYFIDSLQRVSIVGIFDILASETFPYRYLNFRIASRFNFTRDENFELKLHIVDPDGERFPAIDHLGNQHNLLRDGAPTTVHWMKDPITKTFSVDSDGSTFWGYVFWTVPMVQFGKPGRYLVEILANDIPICTVPFDVYQVTPTGETK